MHWPLISLFKFFTLRMRFFYAIICSLCSLDYASASVTVWSQIAIGHPTGTASAAAANYTGAAAYDPTVLTAPAIPNPAPPNTFFLQLLSSNTSQSGLSIMQKGSFFGFSIEMSVVNQVREYKQFSTRNC
jgi:hypothetical protein